MPARALVEAAPFPFPLLLPPFPLLPPDARVLVEADPPAVVAGALGTKVAEGLAMQELAAGAADAWEAALTVPLPAKSQAVACFPLAS
jgi:hypothetical protein